MTFWWAMACQGKEARKGFLKPHKWAEGEHKRFQQILIYVHFRKELITWPRSLPFSTSLSCVPLPSGSPRGSGQASTGRSPFLKMQPRMPDYHKAVSPKWKEHSSLGERMENEEVQKDKRLSSQSTQVLTLVFSYRWVNLPIPSASVRQRQSSSPQKWKVWDHSNFLFIREIYTGHWLSG